jgi:hypothetical protein
MQNRLSSHLAAIAALALSTRAASAFCRASGCDTAQGQQCERDANGCVEGQLPLHWSDSCLTFTVQRDGSPRNDIGGAELETAVASAFATWTSADCGNGARPSLRIESLGQVQCDRVEYNPTSGNANVFVFRDESWLDDGGSGDVLGLTTAHYQPSTGRIWDVDVELNGTSGDISVGDPEDGADLASILTHETGHFLGLDHTREVNAVMYGRYQPMGPALRVLAPDDVAGVCALFPPGSAQIDSACRPSNGLSAVCGSEQQGPRGCAMTPARPTPPLAFWIGLALVAATSKIRQQRRVRRP